MTGFELHIASVGNDRSTNWATTTAQVKPRVGSSNGSLGLHLKIGSKSALPNQLYTYQPITSIFYVHISLNFAIVSPVS